MERRTILVGTSIIALLVLSAGLIFFLRKPSFHGSVIDPPMLASDIKLTDSNGQPFDLGSQRGKVVLLYFGFTNCKDECPLTMAKLKQTFDLLGPASAQVQVLMVTTDPANDTPAQLKNYLTAFNPTFLGLTGPAQDLQQVYKDYGVAVDNNGETHTVFLYILDSKGNLRLTYIAPETDPGNLADDVKLLLRGD